jgi:putative endonuclease
MYFTYIIKNQKDNFYIGQTNNPTERLFRHNSNKVRPTKNKGPWEIIYQKEFDTRTLAINHEKYLKSLKSKKYIKESIINNI